MFKVRVQLLELACHFVKYDKSFTYLVAVVLMPNALTTCTHLIQQLVAGRIVITFRMLNKTLKWELATVWH